MNERRALLIHHSSFFISFQNLARLHRPEDEVEFVEVYRDFAGEAAQRLFEGQVARARRRRLGRSGDAEFGGAAADVLVEDRVAAVADVAQEVARLFVAEALDAALAREPVAPLRRVAGTFEPPAQAQ